MNRTEEELNELIEAQETTINDFEIALRKTSLFAFRIRAEYRAMIEDCEMEIEILKEELDFAPGSTGPLVNFFEKELTEKEWLALKTIHQMRLRLECGIRFDWSKSIDVKHGNTSQIIDEDVIYRNCPVDEEES